MIVNVRHTGIVVRDIDRMAEFYRSLGFVDDNRAIEEGEFIDQVTGLKNTKLEWIKMKSPDGYLLELLQYHSHPIDEKVINANSNKLGCSHLAYTVKSLADTCRLIKQSGGSVVNEPAISPNSMVKVAYCHDPEGVLIEIVEEL